MSCRRIVLAVLALLGSTGAAGAPRTEDETIVRDWISARLHENFDPSRIDVAFADLNGDGRRDALAYLHAPGDCGSGGCRMYVLENRGRSYRLVGRTTITKPPIRVLNRRTNGWRDIGVRVSGYGRVEGYEVLLRFDGWKYPGNPSMQTNSRHFRDRSGRDLIPFKPPASCLSASMPDDVRASRMLIAPELRQRQALRLSRVPVDHRYGFQDGAGPATGRTW